MSNESENNKRWIKEAKKENAKYILDVLDSFDYSHYPVYVKEDEILEVVKQRYSSNMQSVYSVIEVK